MSVACASVTESGSDGRQHPADRGGDYAHQKQPGSPSAMCTARGTREIGDEAPRSRAVGRCYLEVVGAITTRPGAACVAEPCAPSRLRLLGAETAGSVGERLHLAEGVEESCDLKQPTGHDQNGAQAGH